MDKALRRQISKQEFEKWKKEGSTQPLEDTSIKRKDRSKKNKNKK